MKQSTDDAILVPQRFAANSVAPFVLVQCTWDLSADKCKQCLDELTANVTDMFAIKTQDQRKSHSCSVRYSNTSFMVVPFSAAPVRHLRRDPSIHRARRPLPVEVMVER